MQKIIKSNDLKISLIFALIGLIASIFVSMYQISMFTEELKQQVMSQLGSLDALIPIAAAQGMVLTFLAVFFGLKLARKVNLKLNFRYDRNALILAAAIGFAAAFIITGSDRFIFAGYLPAAVTAYKVSPIYLLSGVLYGGIIEEILLRLFVMSLLVLILWKLFAKSKDALQISSRIYWSAIVLAAALFAAGHLPFTFQSIGSSAPIIVRCFVLNGIGGLGFGWLYWKKGLSYAMAAHASTHIFMQLLFMPLF